MNNNWTPCSEELPKLHLVRDIFNRPAGFMSDVVLVTVKSNECDGTRYYVATDYMTGTTQEDVHWFMGCGYGGSAVYSQEIIAWMPKPDPYNDTKHGQWIYWDGWKGNSGQRIDDATCSECGYKHPTVWRNQGEEYNSTPDKLADVCPSCKAIMNKG